MLSLLPQYQHMFEYNMYAVSHQQQVWRLLCGRLVCLDVKDSFCSGLLIYNFRVFERRFGSRKFGSFLVGTWCLSALLDFVLAQALSLFFNFEVEDLPAGLLAPVFALFVPFYLSIPKVPVTQVMGSINITNKTLVYIVGLQLFTSSPFMWLLALSGLISGGLYHANVLWLQKLLFVPAWLCAVARYLLEPLFSTSQPTSEAPLGMGATLDIQRQQRMDQLDQQLLLAQFEARANSRHQAQQTGLLQWTRLFPSLRARRAAPTQAQTQPSAPPPPLDNSVVEEQVARLVEMGFSRMDALEALRASNNDINMATNFLLQH
ncbi:ubiquitin-associated domain-containing protein 2 isoform X3 [Syngnathoides biaculeatus]|nr:ubiquitin-associated domain-containing protein 2 isoform X3 [Syngnathoides biaculeatus]